jgi:P27 family predicted phage terminase small subunit
MPGPPPKPSAIRALEGDRGKQKKNHAEPKPKRGCASPPKSLTGLALEEWNRLVPVLDEIGLLTHADRTVMVTYCRLWSRLEECAAAIRDAGEEMPIKAIKLESELASTMLRYLGQLGLTPAARTRMVAPGPELEKPNTEDPAAKAAKKWGT